MLDRGAPSPLYHQARQYILERIEAGVWPVGSQIPTEHQLCRTLSVSRATVVRALTELVNQGVLERQHGKGTFVASPRVPHGPFELKSFTEEHAERGHHASARLLGLTEAPASPMVRSQLGLAEGERVVRIHRLRFVDTNQPMGIQASHIPSALVPGIEGYKERLEGSLYRLLEDVYRIRFVRAVETFEPVLLDGEQARLLEAEGARLAFHVQRISYDAQGRAVEYVESYMRGDRYRYTMELLRRTPGT
jgi:GntR family transcriptional regulator